MLVGMSHPYDELDLAALQQRPLAKWRYYHPDVLPLWVADMDFPIAEGVRAALRAYADGDLHGYPLWTGIPGLRELVAERVTARTGWKVDPEWISVIPGTVAALYGSVKAFTSQGDGVLANTPIYPPFRSATTSQGRVFQEADLVETDAGFRVEGSVLDEKIKVSSRLLMLCHPHNPTGRVLDRKELEALGERVLEHRLFVASDELHADLNYGTQHIPFASLSPEISARTITFVGPTKTFNLAGLQIGFAIAENPDVLSRFKEAMAGMASSAPAVSQAGAMGALRDSHDWYEDTMAYLRANRDHVMARVHRMEGMKMYAPEATYLAWLDFRGSAISEDPAKALIERGRLGLSDGVTFGEAGRGFARLNFATSREIVDEALDRIERVLSGV